MDGNDFVLKKGANSSLPVALTLEHVSPVTQLLEKRKQMLEVQKALDAQKDKYAREEELFKRREENLRKKDLELQEALVLFNKFLKENEHKRRRAEHRAQEEEKKTELKRQEIEKSKKALEQARTKLEMKKRKHEKNVKYEKFLQNAVDVSDHNFEENDSVITRYNTLKSTNEYLQEKQEKSAQENEDVRNLFKVYQKNQNNARLALNNQLARDNKRYEDAKNASATEAETRVKEEQLATLQKRITTQLIMAVDNLSTRCKKAVKVIKHSVELGGAKGDANLQEQEAVKMEETLYKLKLDVIGNYLQDFMEIVHIVESGMENTYMKRMHKYM